ncbi:hypothetical protein ACFS5L_18955 [Streptomyces phyllanthi]|uniref:hypothetical protein n=1 Tax=Streptomyces phyllanthi TaxID=1803180 RepID=UPI001D157A38|nr:hypothetical protein [Streptomyces phyllanthi]
MHELKALLREYDRARAYTDDRGRTGEVRAESLGHALPPDPTSDRLSRVDGHLVLSTYA